MNKEGIDGANVPEEGGQGGISVNEGVSVGQASKSHSLNSILARAELELDLPKED